MDLASIIRIKQLIAPLLWTGVLLAGAGHAAFGQASRPTGTPVTGTVSPGAVGAAVQQPPPLGGLRTVPINSGLTERNATIPSRRHYAGVHDAPLLRGGGVAFQNNGDDRGDNDQWAPGAWYPTAEKPRWRVDSLAEKVDAWRDVVVNDTVCNNTGACVERTTRLRARWNAFCSCYVFADALQRVWRVE